MRIGFLTDIHESVDNLHWAVETLRQQRVDRTLVLGDIFDMGKRIHETLEVLRPLPHESIFGNHELGLCVEPTSETTKLVSPSVQEYFAACRSTLHMEDVRCTHGMPDWDPEDPTIYYVGRPVWDKAARDTAFATCSERLFFMGHFHRWAIYDEASQLNWQGERPIQLNPEQRYLIVIDAVQNSSCAVFDTRNGLLTPFSRSSSA